MIERDLLGYHASHGFTEHVTTLDAKSFNEPRGVVLELLHRKVSGRSIGQARATVVEHHHS